MARLRTRSTEDLRLVCRKCGSTHITTRYARMLSATGTPRECLSHTCECGYWWNTKCLDADDTED